MEAIISFDKYSFRNEFIPHANGDVMDTTMANCGRTEGWRASKRLAVLGAYEDSAAGARVYEFCRSLSKSLGQDCEITKVACPFNEFCIPQLRKMAAEEAALADLILISARQAASLPPEVKTWIEMWLGQQGRRPQVLVALFDAVYGGDSGPLQAYLKEVAAKGQMEFVIQVEPESAPC